jgi:hypothetical protein
MTSRHRPAQRRNDHRKPAISTKKGGRKIHEHNKNTELGK